MRSSLRAAFLTAALAWPITAQSQARPRQAPRQPPRGVALVANQQSGDVSIIDLATGRTRRVAVGDGPHEAVIFPGSRFGVVSLYGTREPRSRVAVINLEEGTLLGTIEVGHARPHGLAVLPGKERRVAVTSEASQLVAVVNIDRCRVEGTTPTGARGSHMVALPADGRTAWTANIPEGSITELAPSRRQTLRTVPIASMTEGIAVTPNGAEVWVGSNDRGTVSVFDTKRGAVSRTLTGFRMPYRLAVSPDGKLAVVCDPTAGAVTVIDVASKRVLGAVTGLASPRGVKIADDSRTALVTLNGSRELAVVDLRVRKILARYPVGDSPDGVGWAASVPRLADEIRADRGSCLFAALTQRGDDFRSRCRPEPVPACAPDSSYRADLHLVFGVVEDGGTPPNGVIANVVTVAFHADTPVTRRQQVIDSIGGVVIGGGGFGRYGEYFLRVAAPTGEMVVRLATDLDGVPGVFAGNYRAVNNPLVPAGLP